MKKLIKFVKVDYSNVREALRAMWKTIPEWVVVLYYVIVGSVALVFLPAVLLYIKIRVWLMFRKIMRGDGI